MNRQRNSTCTDLATRPPECSTCLAVPYRILTEHPALFYHAGYGETVRLSVDVCRCGTRLVARESVR